MATDKDMRIMKTSIQIQCGQKRQFTKTGTPCHRTPPRTYAIPIPLTRTFTSFHMLHNNPP